ncbi:Hypothetical predicted protein [Cloeon dipterum]|uniref:Histone RNA hairpin-binding protein RNA-binding domain-containing protein n=2 Tax=Cloeon dipterum TaxID=197152 RepID=A0A8S1CL67_9INSE|nr:Hypothetical predicted protein [Cloeon dipterum]
MLQVLMPSDAVESPAAEKMTEYQSWADMADSNSSMNRTPIKEERFSSEDECLDSKPNRAFKKIDFGTDESPMKTESPAKGCQSPDLMNCSPAKTPIKEEPQSTSGRSVDVTRRLWSSPRRREREARLPKLGLAISPRRPLCPPDSPVMSPRDLKRKRPKDLFNSGSPAGSLCSSPGDRGIFSPRPKKKNMDELETDPLILSRRDKQIDYGKNTEGYRRYIEMVPKPKRTPNHPHTPPRDMKNSRRGWDGCIRKWRQQLHEYDPPNDEDDLDNLDTMSEVSLDMGSDNQSEISYPGSGSRKRVPRPSSTISLDEAAN